MNIQHIAGIQLIIEYNEKMINEKHYDNYTASSIIQIFLSTMRKIEYSIIFLPY